jgi:cytochrome c-type protein NapB
VTRLSGLQVGVIAAVAVAVVGLVSGVEISGREVSSYVERRPSGSDAPVTGARSYRDMRDQTYGPNAGLPVEWWKTLRGGGGPDLFAAVVQTEADRTTALAARGSRRAYDGAPPVVPHAVDQIAVPSCLACHEQGVTLATRRAPTMSHERHDSCLQCHVVAADPRRDVVTPPQPESTFVGLGPPGRGERAWEGAPPTIPHTTWMRERCDACHGTGGWHGVRSTHPWRQSCTQCHAPSATLDQRAPVDVGGAP